VPEEVRADLTFIAVDTMDQVLEHALERTPRIDPDLDSAIVVPIAPTVVATDDDVPGPYAH
jgi:hypothetical protein